MVRSHFLSQNRKGLCGIEFFEGLRIILVKKENVYIIEMFV